MREQRLATDKGSPARNKMAPIYRLHIADDEVKAVVEVLQSGIISRGKLREKFEENFCEYTGAQNAIILNSGTAALHLALVSLHLNHGSEVIIPSLSFVATAFAAEYCQLKPVFAEVDPETFNISVEDVRRKITDKTRAVIAVDYAGLPADLQRLKALCRKYGLYFVEDAAHAIGAHCNGTMIGNYSDVTAFSLFATKNMTAGEGGIVTTNNKDWADHIRLLRAHGITPLENAPKVSGFYDVKYLGFNYHLSDLNIALAIEQLNKLNHLNNLRREKAAYLTKLLDEIEEIETPVKSEEHVHHLYSIRLRRGKLIRLRDQIIAALKAEGIQTGVYYLPIHLHTYFRRKYGFCEGSLPITELVCNSIMTLPFYPTIAYQDLDDIAQALKKVIYNMQLQ